MPKKAQHKVPKPGLSFARIFQGEKYVLTVVSENGRTMYRLGKNSYRSPSAAAKKITCGEVNGWKFWKII